MICPYFFAKGIFFDKDNNLLPSYCSLSGRNTPACNGKMFYRDDEKSYYCSVDRDRGEVLICSEDKLKLLFDKRNLEGLYERIMK